MKRKFNPYTLPPWLRTCRSVCAQFIIPFCVFQGIRTILIPTTFDVLLLSVFILLALALHLEFI
ncbi:hypothetical protein LCM00_05350 [Bacillus infantis]|jgi:hypothetical protein|uniref:hypothetical protein n=1 Tax=Bacillus infantis TaxID=324767 RepID=UPI00101C98A6|nr:hypothetical protein [Bacillus infantis]MCA1038928.1 hypothetical protein [Bacillus infantis]MCR6612184.1 hypothetical protein [Bacillus infantis]RYI31628.1 hypothetical protein EVU96_06375 [Bacillus infantis]